MAKLSRKAELTLWWDEYRARINALIVIVLTMVIILAVFYPFSSEIVSGEVKAVSLSKTNIDTLPKATIYSPKIGEIIIVVPIGVSLTIGDKVEISRGKTIVGIYKYVFIKKVSSDKE